MEPRARITYKNIKNVKAVENIPNMLAAIRLWGDMVKFQGLSINILNGMVMMVEMESVQKLTVSDLIWLNLWV